MLNYVYESYIRREFDILNFKLRETCYLVKLEFQR